MNYFSEKLILEERAKAVDEVRLELIGWRRSATANKGFESAIRIVSNRASELRKEAGIGLGTLRDITDVGEAGSCDA